MATHHGSTEEGSSKIKKNLDDWKYPKIPVDQVYKKKILRISPTYAIKDYEDTITVNRNDKTVSGSLLSSNFLEGFIKKQHRFVHLGLVQIAVKPLMRDGLGAPIVVTLQDTRHHDFHNSLLALVKADLSKGPFYFNCFPSFSVSLDDDASLFEVLTLHVETGGIPLALAYRVVCKAMVDLSPEALKEPVLGETIYFRPATGARGITKWVESQLQVHESSTREHVPEPHDRALNKGSSISSKFANEEDGSCQNRRNLDGVKFPRVPVKKVYKSNMNSVSEIFQGLSRWSKAKKMLKSTPSTVRDYEKTIPLKSNDQINKTLKLLEGFIKMNDGFVHLGLFQVAIRPLSNDKGLGGSIIVCLRDTRFIKFEASVKALVEANVCDGPFYFNCCPGHSIASKDHKCFTLSVMSGVPLVLTYRIVCNVSHVTMDVTPFESSVQGETAFYHLITRTESTTKWDEVQVPESWI